MAAQISQTKSHRLSFTCVGQNTFTIAQASVLLTDHQSGVDHMEQLFEISRIIQVRTLFRVLQSSLGAKNSPFEDIWAVTHLLCAHGNSHLTCTSEVLSAFLLDHSSEASHTPKP